MCFWLRFLADCAPPSVSRSLEIMKRLYGEGGGGGALCSVVFTSQQIHEKLDDSSDVQWSKE
jgi:hypothetical protein